MTPTLIDRIRPRTGPTAPSFPSARGSGRLLGVALLIGLSVAALRVPLPAPATRSVGTGGGSAVAVTAALLGASVAVLAVALVARARAGPRPRLPVEHEGRRRPAHEWSRRDLVWIAGAAVVLTGALLLPLVGHVVVTPTRQPSGSSISQTTDRPARSETGARPGNGAESSPRPGGGSLWTVSAIALPTLLALMTAGALLGRRRTPVSAATTTPGVRPHSPSEHESLTRAAELGLAAVAEPQRDARSAIIACYVAMESALAGTADAAPQDSDTPSEVLARAVARGVVRPGSAGALVRLFSEARFSSHPMTERHRELAVGLLRATLDDLRSNSCVP